MASQTKKDTKPCARIRTQKLLKKVDHLTIQLEDTIASIQMITNSIDDEDTRFRRLYSDYNAECRLNYEQETETLENKLQHRQDECTKLINEKEILSDQLEILLTGAKAKEQMITNDRIDQIRMDMEVKIEQAKTEWKQGLKKREDEWMSERVSEVKNRTLVALQPQVQKLLHSHKVELEQVKEQFSYDEENTMTEMARCFQKRVADYKREMDEKAKMAYENRRQLWMQQLHHLQKEQSVKMHQMNNRNREEKEKLLNEYKEEISTMIEKQSAKLGRLQQSGVKDIEKVQHQFTLKLERVRGEFDTKRTDLENTLSKRMEELQKEKEAARQSQLESQMISNRLEMKNSRDNQINEIIKSFQKEESNYEKELRFIYEKAEQKSMANHISTIDRIKKQIQEREPSQSLCSFGNEQNLMNACVDELELVQMLTFKAQEKQCLLDREEEQLQRAVNPKIDATSKSILIREQNVNELQKGIDELIKETTSISSSNKAELDAIQRDHEEKLESLEKEVKHSIAQIEKDIDDIDREIARYKNRVEKQREILVQYNLKDTEE